MLAAACELATGMYHRNERKYRSEESAERRLSGHLIDLATTGKLPAERVIELAQDAEEAGAMGVRKMAKLKRNSNAARSLRKALLKAAHGHPYITSGHHSKMLRSRRRWR